MNINKKKLKKKSLDLGCGQLKKIQIMKLKKLVNFNRENWVTLKYQLK